MPVLGKRVAAFSRSGLDWSVYKAGMAESAFLEVNRFLGTELDARAIKSAMELGLLDELEAKTSVSLPDFASARGFNRRGVDLLASFLEVNGVLEREGQAVVLSPAFRKALAYRDLLETKIEFADLVWPDIHHLFTPLLIDLPQFMARSKVFDLFRYDRCVEITDENLAATAAWTKFTTCLTRYEAIPAFQAIDLEGVDRFVDFGGNTGEFAFQLCRRRPDVEAVVVDLPVVCALGARHLAKQDQAFARRVTFFPCDMRRDELPAAADLVSFKSVLHDWPDEDAERLLERASAVVRPGGRLMIFERCPIEIREKVPFSLISDLVFLHFLRPADFYIRKLEQLGFSAIDYKRIELDIGFHLIVAERPA